MLESLHISNYALIDNLDIDADDNLAPAAAENADNLA